MKDNETLTYCNIVPYSNEMEHLLLVQLLRLLNEKQRINIYNALGERFSDKSIHNKKLNEG